MSYPALTIYRSHCLLVLVMGCLPKLLKLTKLKRRSTTQVSDKFIEYIDCCVKKYTWDDIGRITANLSREIGSGGFSTVYLADLPNLSFGAVKIQASSDHLNQLFKQELDILLRLHHKSIVKFLGYCDDDHQGGNALVFEYAPNGSLQDNLHGGERKSSCPILSWERRMIVAFQLSQALEYLHEKCTPQIVHGDIKSSNILLDEDLNCKLCDFGFSKMGFSSTVMPPSRGRGVMMGSPGYTDPHYLRTGIASKKNDVYSYGVIILELVTGMEAFCEERGQLLTSIMGPMLRDARDCEATKVAQMVDPRLGGDFDLKEARAMLSISALCLAHSPVLRPSATHILHDITQNIASISFLFSVSKDVPNTSNYHFNFLLA